MTICLQCLFSDRERRVWPVPVQARFAFSVILTFWSSININDKICLNAHLVDPKSNDKMVAFQDGEYLMDQEFDGKGLTPYDPAHNSTYILAGKTLTTISGKNIGGWTWERKRKGNK